MAHDRGKRELRAAMLMLLACAAEHPGAGPAEGADTATDTGIDSAGPIGEILGNAVDDDGDGNIDELDPPDTLFPAALRDIGTAGWVAQDAGAGPVVYTAPTGEDWSTVVPIGWRSDDVCCGSSTKFWAPDLDGDGVDELVVNGDDERWSGNTWSYTTLVYPGTVVTEGAFSTADALAESSAGIYGRSRSADGFALLVLNRLGSTGLLAPASLEDGLAEWEEAVASVADGWTHPGIMGSTDDLDGDGIDDLIVVRDLGEGTERLPEVQVFDGLALDALELPPEASAADVNLPAGAYTVASGAVADVDGDGIADLALDYRTLDGAFGAQDAVFRGPLAGQVEASTIIDVTEEQPGDGATVELGDVDGDGRSDLAFGHDRRDGGVLCLFLGATLSAGGTLDSTTDRWGARATPEYADLVFYAFSADFDGDGGRDLALWTLDPIGPDGEAREHTFASEVYLNLPN